VWFFLFSISGKSSHTKIRQLLCLSLTYPKLHFSHRFSWLDFFLIRLNSNIQYIRQLHPSIKSLWLHYFFYVYICFATFCFVIYFFNFIFSINIMPMSRLLIFAVSWSLRQRWMQIAEINYNFFLSFSLCLSVFASFTNMRSLNTITI
jgi:hypothetical protein